MFATPMVRAYQIPRPAPHTDATDKALRVPIVASKTRIALQQARAKVLIAITRATACSPIPVILQILYHVRVGENVALGRTVVLPAWTKPYAVTGVHREPPRVQSAGLVALAGTICSHAGRNRNVLIPVVRATTNARAKMYAAGVVMTSTDASHRNFATTINAILQVHGHSAERIPCAVPIMKEHTIARRPTIVT